MLLSNGGEILQKEKAAKELSRDPATGLTRRPGNRMLEDRTEEAFAANVITEW